MQESNSRARMECAHVQLVSAVIGGPLVKRLGTSLLLVAALGAIGYGLWLRLFPRASPDGQFAGTTSVHAYRTPDDPLDADVDDLTDEFFSKPNAKPSINARKRIQDLAANGPKGGNKMVLVVDDWLGRLYDAGLAESDEFRELSQALRAVDPEFPHRLVKNHYPAVLAKWGADAIPAIVLSLHDESLQVRVQGIRALELIGPEKAAAALPALRPLSGDDQPVELRAAARALVERIDSQ
jgi:hypothetical protein